MFSLRTLKPHPTPRRRLKVNGRRRSKSLACSPADSRSCGRRRAPAVGKLGLRAGGAAGAGRRRAVSRQSLAHFGAAGGGPGAQPGGARCVCRAAVAGGGELRPGEDDGAPLLAAARPRPGLPAPAQHRGPQHRHLRARAPLSAHLPFRRRCRAGDAASSGRRRHLSLPGRLLHLRPGPARRRDAGLAIRQGGWAQGADRQFRRAGQCAQPSRARLRSRAARPLCVAAGQGGGDLDHPGPTRARHRRRIVARLLAALRAGERQAPTHRHVRRLSPAPSPRRRQVSAGSSCSPSSMRSA